MQSTNYKSKLPEIEEYFKKSHMENAYEKINFIIDNLTTDIQNKIIKSFKDKIPFGKKGNYNTNFIIKTFTEIFFKECDPKTIFEILYEYYKKKCPEHYNYLLLLLEKIKYFTTHLIEFKKKRTSYIKTNVYSLLEDFLKNKTNCVLMDKIIYSLNHVLLDMKKIYVNMLNKLKNIKEISESEIKNYIYFIDIKDYISIFHSLGIELINTLNSSFTFNPKIIKDLCANIKKKYEELYSFTNFKYDYGIYEITDKFNVKVMNMLDSHDETNIIKIYDNNKNDINYLRKIYITLNYDFEYLFGPLENRKLLLRSALYNSNSIAKLKSYIEYFIKFKKHKNLTKDLIGIFNLLIVIGEENFKNISEILNNLENIKLSDEGTNFDSIINKFKNVIGKSPEIIFNKNKYFDNLLDSVFKDKPRLIFKKINNNIINNILENIKNKKLNIELDTALTDNCYRILLKSDSLLSKKKDSNYDIENDIYECIKENINNDLYEYIHSYKNEDINKVNLLHSHIKKLINDYLSIL